jgi:hypothetical protein
MEKPGARCIYYTRSQGQDKDSLSACTFWTEGERNMPCPLRSFEDQKKSRKNIGSCFRSFEHNAEVYQRWLSIGNPGARKIYPYEEPETEQT